MPVLVGAILYVHHHDMKLLIFDIDGTILDSTEADDQCFIQTFKDLYQISVPILVHYCHTSAV